LPLDNKVRVAGSREGGMMTSEAKAEAKELIQDFVLINYDIPATEKKLRRQFLKKALAMGAQQFTESVYLLPYSETALEMANELESAGHAVVWAAHQHNVSKALEINLSMRTASKTAAKRLSSGW